jgi:hypothetical protein
MEKLEGYSLELSTKSWRVQHRLFLLKDGRAEKLQHRTFHKKLEITASTFSTKRWRKYYSIVLNYDFENLIPAS